MSIPLGPDWNKLYDEGKCLDRGVPFTDEQQLKLFKLGNNKAEKDILIRRWRAEHEANKLKDPKEVQAHANAEAIKKAMKGAIVEEVKSNEEVGTQTTPNEDEVPSDEEAVNLEDMTVKSLVAQAQELGLSANTKMKKADLIAMIEEALSKKDEE